MIEKLQTLILSGILFTLLTVAYKVGEFTNEIKMVTNDHEKRISKIETKVFK